jgi:hypothetical protein
MATRTELQLVLCATKATKAPVEMRYLDIQYLNSPPLSEKVFARRRGTAFAFQTLAREFVRLEHRLQ